LKSGVIDPIKVSRTALQNAELIAGLIPTIGAVISDVFDDKGDKMGVESIVEVGFVIVEWKKKPSFSLSGGFLATCNR
jgi:hypothetical protein